MSEKKYYTDEQVKKLVEKIDGWSNVLTGLGRKNYDKTESTFFQNTTCLDDGTLTDIYRAEGLGARIVDIIPDDMTRRWMEITNDDSGVMTKELNRLNLRGMTNEAKRWARLYGGAVIFMSIDDGGKLEDPVTPNRVKNIDFLRVYARPDITLSHEKIVTDVNSTFFDDLEILTIQTLSGNLIPIHRSRLLVFKGKTVPRLHGALGSRANSRSTQTPLEDWFWGISIVNQIWSRLSNLCSSEKGIANIMQELVIGVFKIANLVDLLSSGREQELYTRMDIIQASKSIINAVLLGENESFDRNIANLAGAPEILSKMMLMVTAVSGIPLTRLFGQAPSGLSTDDESGTRTYYDGVAAGQHNELEPAIWPCLQMVGSYTKVAEPTVMWLPLMEMTEKERAEIYEINSRADKTYIETSVLTDAEVRAARFENGYSSEIVIEDMNMDGDKLVEGIKRVAKKINESGFGRGGRSETRSSS